MINIANIDCEIQYLNKIQISAHHPSNDTVKGIRDSLFSHISAISRKPISDNRDPIMIAIDNTHEDSYGDRDSCGYIDGLEIKV